MKKVLAISIIIISCSPAKRIERNEKARELKMLELDSMVHEIFKDPYVLPAFEGPLVLNDSIKK